MSNQEVTSGYSFSTAQNESPTGFLTASGEPYELPVSYTLSQQKVLTRIPHVTASISFLGSVSIIAIIMMDRRQKLKRVYYRLMLGLCVIDAAVSISYGLSSLVVPRNTPWVWNGMGTVGTCEASGFVNQFQTSVLQYTAFLCLYYVLITIFQFQEATIARWWEPFFHGIAWLHPTATGILALQRDLYNPVDVSIGWCMLDDYPPNCSFEGSNVDCIRGDNFGQIVVLGLVLPVLLSALTVFICTATILIRLSVLQRRIASRYHIANAKEQHQKRLFTDAVIQAGLHIASIVLTLTPQGIVIGATARGTAGNFLFSVTVLNKTFLPLTGLWTFLIFVRPRYVALQRRHRHATILQLWAMIAWPKSSYRQHRTDAYGDQLVDHPSKDQQTGWRLFGSKSEQQLNSDVKTNESSSVLSRLSWWVQHDERSQRKHAATVPEQRSIYHDDNNCDLDNENKNEGGKDGDMLLFPPVGIGYH